MINVEGVSTIIDEKWGRFVDTDLYGQALITLNQSSYDGQYSISITVRLKNVREIVSSLPFCCKNDAIRLFKALNPSEVESSVTNELEWLLIKN